MHRSIPLIAIIRSRLTLVAACAFGSCQFSNLAPAAESAPRERILISNDWRFHRGDAPGVGESLDYSNLRVWELPVAADFLNGGVTALQRPAGADPGAGVTFVDPGFDDSGWRQLDLPHDWGIEGPFLQERPGDTGKLPWSGVGWYRKRLPIEAADAGRRIYIDFDGAMAYSAVWLNGRFVGGWPYGYASFRLDLTPFVDFDGPNVLAVRLDNPDDSSRWYPGSGIYRNVWLAKTAPVHVAHWGVFVTTPIVSAEEAVVEARVKVENTTDQKVALKLVTALYELGDNGRLQGKPVTMAEPIAFDMNPPGGCVAMRTHTFHVAHPKLWDLASPHRYVAVTTLEQDGQVVDRVETPFGIRSIHFTADDGFYLNGRRVQFQGVCLHHDLGALGTAVNVRAIERQLELLQAMGCNAIRTAHNPPAPELLELCDRFGLLVMDETFDTWRRGKKRSPDTIEADGPAHYRDYARVFDDWHEPDTRALVRRDRNHPSIVMWSIGNEVVEQNYNDGWGLAARLAGIVREEDRTRPVTIACHRRYAPFNGFASAVDVIGFNYKPDTYERFHTAFPDVPVIGSETASTTSTRGEYFFPVNNDQGGGRSEFQVSSYDLYAPDWAHPPEVEFRSIDEHSFVLGEFVWTGFDYLGEPTPYDEDATNLLNFTDPVELERARHELVELGKVPVPSRSSYFGIIDLAGFPKDRYYLYQARWRPDLPMAHILPHWTWPERTGLVTPVFVYSSGDEAELFLNGKSQGRRKRGALQYRFRWDDVVYEPGEIRAKTWKDGKSWAETTMRTAGPAARLRLSPDRATIRGDGRDLAFVTVTVTDKAGAMVPRAKTPLRFSVAGPGEIVAVDNGDPTSFAPFQATERKAFNGLALVIVRAKPGKNRPFTLRVEADGLPLSKTVITVEPPEA